MASGKPDNSAKLATEIREVDPRTLKGRDKNARYMTAQQMAQLVENLKRDGELTSLPLTYQHDGGTLEVISGHHRVEAAIKAGFATIRVLVIVTRLSDARLTAIQLSHNAINGQDDRSILADLFQSLEITERKYSGLTDDMFGGLDLQLSGLSIGAVTYQELKISFLPEDEAEFLDLVKRVEKKAKGLNLVAPLTIFDRLFDTLIAVKRFANVQNAGIAMCLLAQLADERLAQLEKQANGREGEAGSTANGVEPDQQEAGS